MSLLQPEPLNNADATPRPTLAGDWSDDDGQVFDDLVQPQANPLPAPKTELVEPVTKRPPRTGRLLGNTIALDSTWVPFQALPADPNRKQLVIQVNSAVATDSVKVADDQGKCMSGAGAGLVFPANPLSLIGFTGPVWVSVASGTLVSVSYWAVTE